MLKHVVFAPKCITNLVSLTLFQSSGMHIRFIAGSSKIASTLDHHRRLIGVCESTGMSELSKMNPVHPGNSEADFFDTCNEDTMPLAHRRIFRTAVSTLERMEKVRAVTSLYIVHGRVRSTLSLNLGLMVEQLINP